MPCRVNKAEEWVTRLEHEAAMHQDAQFLTLTYEQEPEGGSLRPADIVLFLKRLRELLQRTEEKTIRFFQVGEYGGNFGRPHHHVLLFGHRFTDLHPIRRGKRPLYTSAQLERLWGHGFVTVGEVTQQSIRYCASYITKTLTGPEARRIYGDRKPEYATMSRRPGIGTTFAVKWRTDFLPRGHMTRRNGSKMRIPRIYVQHWAKDHQEQHRELLFQRRLAAKRDKTTPQQRYARHVILQSKAKLRGTGALHAPPHGAGLRTSPPVTKATHAAGKGGLPAAAGIAPPNTPPPDTPPFT